MKPGSDGADDPAKAGPVTGPASAASPSPGSAGSAGLWDFALSVYGQEGVAGACLRLQERHGLDVTLLLFCCWAGRFSRSLQPAELAAIHAEVAPWHDAVVRPLRHARQWMKTGGGVAALPEAAALREEIKARELEAERLELLRLEQFLRPGGCGPSCGCGQPHNHTAGDSGDDAAGKAGGEGALPPGDPGAAVVNLSGYLSLHSVDPDVDDEAALVRLLVSAFPALRPLSAFNMLRSGRLSEVGL